MREIKPNSKYGFWTVTSVPKGKKVMCQCVCGTEKSVNKYNLLNGKTSSCGCKVDYSKVKKHGLTGVPEYQVWKGMKARCTNKKHKNYSDYGGRGITVCQRWVEDFSAFYSDMGPRPSSKHSIDRIDNELGYEPSNCAWVDQKQQTRKTRRSKLITIGDETKTIAEWSEITGIKDSTIYHRVAVGDSGKHALREARKICVR